MLRPSRSPSVVSLEAEIENAQTKPIYLSEPDEIRFNASSPMTPRSETPRSNSWNCETSVASSSYSQFNFSPASPSYGSRGDQNGLIIVFMDCRQRQVCVLGDFLLYVHHRGFSALRAPSEGGEGLVFGETSPHDIANEILAPIKFEMHSPTCTLYMHCTCSPVTPPPCVSDLYKTWRWSDWTCLGRFVFSWSR